MDKDRSHVSDRILSLTLEIIFLLTGEDYAVVKKRKGGRVPGGRSRTQSPITVPPPHSLIHERYNDQKILELTNKIIQLLTGEEREYVEGEKEMPESRSPLALSGVSECTVNKSTSSCVKEELGPSKDRDHSDNDLYTPTDHAPYISAFVKKELVSFEEGDPPDPDLGTPMGGAHLVQSVSCRAVKDLSPNTSDTHHAPSPTQVGSCDEGDFTDSDNYTETDYPPCPDTDVYDNEDSETYVGNDSGETFRFRAPSPSRLPPLSSEVYVCLVCQECFTNNSDLVEHQAAHRAPHSVICSDCGKYFASNSLLSRHQRIHTGEKPYTCSVCGKSFNQKSLLITHYRTHTGEKPYSCTQCGKCFISSSKLSLHQRTHTGEKPFSCPDCAKRFSCSTNLILHQRTHTGEKPFSCPDCGKCFSRSAHLSLHQRIHTGIKPYSCDECGKCFSRSAHLILHARIHTGEKPYTCSCCGKCFSQKSSLVSHWRTHTGEKPYSCAQCGKSFTKKTVLNNHLKSHS